MTPVARLLTSVITAIAASATAAVAIACSCAPYDSAAAHLADAEAAFRGRVVSTSGNALGSVTTFQVQATIKGRPGRTVRVRHGTSSAACGVTFQRGRSYLVLANAGPDGLSTNLCFGPQFTEAQYRAAARTRS